MTVQSKYCSQKETTEPDRQAQRVEKERQKRKKALLYAVDVLEALQRDILSQPRSPLFHAQEKMGVYVCYREVQQQEQVAKFFLSTAAWKISKFLFQQMHYDLREIHKWNICSVTNSVKSKACKVGFHILNILLTWIYFLRVSSTMESQKFLFKGQKNM